MKLLFLASSVRHNLAGAGQAMHALANYVSASGAAEVTVACHTHEDGVLRDEIRILRLPEPASLRGLWRIDGYLRPYRLVSSFRAVDLGAPDLVYTSGVDYAVAFARAFPTVPIVLHAGATISSREILTEGQPSLVTRLQALAEDRSVRSALKRKNIVHVVSTPLVARERAEFYGVHTESFDISPYGVDLRRFPPDASYPDMRAALNIPPDAFVACSVARLVEWKRLDMLIEAARSATSSPWILIVGDGPERVRLENLAAHLGVGARVRFVGSTNPSPYLAASDVFVLPSEIESFGLAYAEAMTMGLACIGRRYRPPQVISSAADVIPAMAGFQVDNASEIAGYLDRLAQNPDLCRAMGRAAKEYAAAHYTTAAYFDRIKSFGETRYGLSRGC
jgi:glycosyltransferase involved in cell wall biosynthesis